MTTIDIPPGATHIFGDRKLRKLYLGPSIRVRRASDGTEADIGFTPVHGDVTALEAFAGGSTYTVLIEYDQSGNGNHRHLE